MMHPLLIEIIWTLAPWAVLIALAWLARSWAHKRGNKS
jgi:heme/copper-type cytochrome/quinol oxidase subunit 2